MAQTLNTQTHRSRRFSLVLGFVLAASATGVACSKHDPPPPTIVQAAPVEAPAGLVAELFVPKPSAVWAGTRDIGFGPSAMFPQSAALFFGGLLELEPRAIEQLDP